jgi:hypothetical protein
VAVQIPESQHNLGTVESRAVFGEDAHLGQMKEKLASVNILHDKAQAVGRLE